MKAILRCITGAALLAGLAATGAEAMPVAPPAALAGAGPVTLARDGCGPYGHRSHFGYCKPNGYGFGGPPPFYGPPRVFRPPPPRCVVRYTYFGPRRFCRW